MHGIYSLEGENISTHYVSKAILFISLFNISCLICLDFCSPSPFTFFIRFLLVLLFIISYVTSLESLGERWTIININKIIISEILLNIHWAQETASCWMERA